MVYGKYIRLGRILDLKAGKSIIFPMDHGGYMGPIKGIEKPWSMLKIALDSGVDSILIQKGLIKSYYEKLSRYSKNIGIILRVSAAYVDSKIPDIEEVVSSCHEALILGADAVAFTIYIGGKLHNEAIKLFGKMVDECDSLGLPMIGECMPSRELGVDLKAVKKTVRICAELGADVIKTIYVEPFREVVDICPVPIVIAGGEKREDKYILKMVKKAVEAGASGICIGRNVFQHENPRGMLNAIIKIVKDNISLDEANKILRSVAS